jgi:hypothetical protein
MKTKTAELTGAALDWAVAKITNPEWTDEDRRYNTIGYVDTGDIDDEPYAPSTDWAQGGPIIEREKIDTNHISIDQYSGDSYWVASFPRPATHKDLWRFGYGPTLLIAAMRCYVANKLGDEVEVPDGLV